MRAEAVVDIGHVVMQMDDALGPPGRARGIHPEGHVIGAGVRGVENRVAAIEKALRLNRLGKIAPAFQLL